jgi:hypothetical protein
MNPNFQSAREAITRLSDRFKNQAAGSADAAEVDALAAGGLNALDAIELELELLRRSHTNAMKALLHRIGDPG